MQIDRLLEIVLILLGKGHVTAAELSEKFGVSTRTIYRDIDALSLAGVPVYSSKGKGGGIGILEGYTLDKSLLTEHEQKEILYALQSFQATRLPNVENILGKLSGLFASVSGNNFSGNNYPSANWIEVDFSAWGSRPDEKIKFALLKEAILTKRTVIIEYMNSSGQQKNREVEPLRLVFKAHSWYVQGFCRYRQDFRIYKISRMKSICLGDDFFEREIPDDQNIDNERNEPRQTVELKLKFSGDAAYRVYDDFNEEMITVNGDGSFNVSVNYPFDEWVISHILSFGSLVEVLEPQFIRDTIWKRASEILEKYKK